MNRVLVLMVAAMLAMGTASAGNGEQFISIYGGYSLNDDSSEAEDDSFPFGIRWGAETPVAGGQISLGLNSVGDIRMDTLLFSILANFASKDTRTDRGRIIYNRASGFITVGAGTMRFETADDADIIFAWEVGIGTQVKFNKTVGFRAQANAINAPAKGTRNYEANIGISFHW